jgi:hypothetical protein
MPEPIAEQLSDIAKRLKEIEEERRKERQAVEPVPELPIDTCITFFPMPASLGPDFVWVPGMVWIR